MLDHSKSKKNIWLEERQDMDDEEGVVREKGKNKRNKHKHKEKEHSITVCLLLKKRCAQREVYKPAQCKLISHSIHSELNQQTTKG